MLARRVFESFPDVSAVHSVLSAFSDDNAEVLRSLRWLATHADAALSARVRVRLAELGLDSGDGLNDAAMALDALDGSSRNGMCLGMLAEVYQALDDSNRELSIRLERSAHEIPGFDELCRIATLHELLGDPQKAAGAYAQLEERCGPGLHIVQGLQRVAESGGDDAEWESAAIRLCQSDWDEAPVEVLIALSAALKQGGREDEADALWGAMTQKAPQDQALLRHALEHSRSPEGASWRRQLAELTDDAEDREALLRKNLEADDVSERLHAMKALMVMSPTDPQIFTLGQTLLPTPEERFAWMQAHAVALDTAGLPIWLDAAQFGLSAGLPGRIATCVDTALEFDPSNETALAIRQQLLTVRGRWEAAYDTAMTRAVNANAGFGRPHSGRRCNWPWCISSHLIRRTQLGNISSKTERGSNHGPTFFLKLHPLLMLWIRCWTDCRNPPLRRRFGSAFVVASLWGMWGRV